MRSVERLKSAASLTSAGRSLAREGGDERERAPVQVGEAGQGLLRDVPGVRELRGVVVADPVVRPGRVGLRGPRHAVGEVPGEEEEGLARLAGGEVDRDRERGHRGVRGARRPLVESPVGQEVVPEVEERPRPAALGPARAGRGRRRPAPVTRASEPHAGSFGSTFSEERKSPWAARGAAERRCGSRRPPRPAGRPSSRASSSTRPCPTKFGSDAQTAASTGCAERLRSSTRKTAIGRPLASASAGTRGFMALRCASTGRSGSVRRTRPNG